MQKAIQQLAFQQIVDGVKKELQFTMSEDYAEHFFQVKTNHADVQDLQLHTAALYQNYLRVGLPDLLPLKSMQIIQQKADKQYVLELEEILRVKTVAINIQRLHTFYEKNMNKLVEQPLMTELLTALVEIPDIIKAIDRVVSESAQVLDKASQLLYTIREGQRDIEQKLRSTLHEIMQKESSKMAENYYTLRNERYVLPIKEEYKNTFKGILHDESQSHTTFYIEPQAIVLLNNKLQNLYLDEKKEVDRIILELSQRIFADYAIISQDVYHLAKFDAYMAKAIFSYKQNYVQPETLATQEIILYDAKHPLLPAETVVGNDIIIKSPYDVLTITGANTGGKSVFLKTIGFQVLLHQFGLFLPIAKDADNKLGVFSDVFMDIGDEQSIEQNLSTFSAHMTNIKRIIEEATSTSLILLDELGSGTDPMQGASLSIAIIEAIHRMQTTLVITTHYNEVKEFIAQQPYAQNAAMSFDFETLRPTYHVRYGSYGQSYAFEIARSLDFPKEIINHAEEINAQYDNDATKLLSIYEERLLALDNQVADQKVRESDFEVEKARFAIASQEIDERLERERVKLHQTMEKEMDVKLEQVNTMLEQLKTKKDMKQNEFAAMQGNVNALKGQKIFAKRSEGVTAKEYQVGDTVFVDSLQANGEVVQIKPKNTYTVKVGMLSMTVKASDMRLVKKSSNKKQKQSAPAGRIRMNFVGSSLDLRGVRVADGLEMLEQYIANAKSSHQSVQIIHGHGTGQMRDAVQKYLKNNKMIKKYRYGGEGEGGVGVTVIDFE